MSSEHFESELSFQNSSYQSLLKRLSEHTDELNADSSNWPAEQIKWLGEAGVLGWVIPKQYGGTELSGAELNVGYEQLAAACLCTTFALTQRNGACQRIAGCENESLKERLLSKLCTGELYATVGISHLTTSRQHLSNPVVRAEKTSNGFKLNGFIPWVTGAIAADYIVTGATCADGKQLMLALSTALSGVSCDPAEQLLSLTASQTGSVQLDNVEVPFDDVIAGPVEDVMSLGIGGGTGSLTTSALAVGLSRSALAILQEEAEKRADLKTVFESLEQSRQQLTEAMWKSTSGTGDPNDPALKSQVIRQQANSLVLRTTQAALAATKGRGFVQGHPAERMVREAMFFLVWSCPQPVVEAALREFACLAE